MAPPAPRRPLVLVVDDDRLLRMLAREALENEGFAVREAADGGEALEFAAEVPPDLVLLDLEMPKVGGLEVCRILRERQPDGAPPILVVTGTDDVAAIQGALEAGASDFITKPVRWQLLGARVRYLLNKGHDAEEPPRAAFSRDAIERIGGLGSWEWIGARKQMTWSRVGCEILGLSPEETVPSYERFLACVHPYDLDVVRESVRESLGGVGRFALEHRIVYPDGSIRYVELRGEIARDGPEAPSVTGTIQDVTEQRLAAERIRYLADYDSLTGLANRRVFLERLERDVRRAAQGRYHVALLYIDIDDFKRINDSFGHVVGDCVLREVAERLVDYVRRTDLVARLRIRESDAAVSRLGGDEFTILLSRIRERENAGDVARRILAELARPISVDGNEVMVTASIGVAVYPHDAQDGHSLVKHADRAMYSAKEQGRNGFQFHSSAMDAAADRKLELESALRRAVEERELRVLYQPKIEVRTGRVTGAEALLRWTDRELGAVSPKEFIPVCEETGLIVEIGEWALHEACRQNAEWQRAGFERIRMAVNASIAQFQRQDLRVTVARALQDSGLDPSDLEIEITESVMLHDAEAIAIVLRDLRAMGVRVALDDFGTGYSSLSFVARFPLDTLKMDRSFIREIDSDHASASVVKAVIAMAHGLQLDVVAEGVDLEEQARFLREEGCDEMQGFLVAGALDADDFARFLRERGAGSSSR